MSHPYKFFEEAVRTKDGITIFSIKVRKIPNSIRMHDIREYFEKFGEVVKVWLPADRDQTIFYKWSDYRIQYADAKTAATVLRIPRHVIQSRSFHIEACSSVEQPDGQQILAQLSEMDFNNMQDNEAPVSALNDDCLECICKFLSIRDQINFALSCRRFAAVLVSRSKAQYKSINSKMFEGLTPFQIYTFLQLIGPQIKSLTVDKYQLDCGWSSKAELYTLFKTILNKVEKFTLFNFRQDAFCRVISKMSLLQELTSNGCSYNDEAIEVLQTCNSLRKFRITQNSFITGSGIQPLTGLEELTLLDCKAIVPNFKDICKNLTNLSYLDVRYMKFSASMDTEDYEHIVKYLPQLKTLKITCLKGDYNCLAQLPNLVKFAIDFEEAAEAEIFFAHLVDHKANQLEELSINSKNITLQIATMVAQLKRLKSLRCFFSVNEETMQQFANLSELEEIEFCKMSNFTNAILKLLQNCLKLIRVRFWCSGADQTHLICKSREFLEKQREQGRRAGCVNYVFKRRTWDTEFKNTSDNYNSSDVLKVTDEVIGFIDYEVLHDDNFEEWDAYDSLDDYGNDRYSCEGSDSDDSVSEHCSVGDFGSEDGGHNISD